MPSRREECRKTRQESACGEFCDAFSSNIAVIAVEMEIQTYKCATGIGTRRITSILPYADVSEFREESIDDEAAL
jgi:hypothetical protein